MIKELKHEPELALDTETVGVSWLHRLYFLRNLYLGSLLDRRKLKRAVIAARSRLNKDSSGLQFWANQVGMVQISTPETVFLITGQILSSSHSTAELGQVLNSAFILIIHHARFDWKILKTHLNIELHCKNVHDTYIAERVLTNGTSASCELKDVIQRRYSKVLSKAKSVRVSNWRGIWSQEMITYAVGDVSDLFQLKADQRRELQAAKLNEIYCLEQKILPINAAMEMRGIGVDLDQIGALKSALQLDVRALSQKVMGILNVVNPNSPNQVLASLQRMGLKIKKTDKKTLQKHLDVPEVKELLKYRSTNTLLTRYFGTFGERSVKQDDGHYRIYAGFNPLGTDSGRWSSSDPNFQNIPKEPEYRAFVIPGPGAVFVCADTSQIELRLLAELAGETTLIEAFASGGDVHKFTASMVYGISEDEVTKEQRYKAKTIGYGIIYGQTAFGLSDQLAISEHEAQDLIDRWLRNFYYIKRWIEATKQKILLTGEARTLLGRRRIFEHLKSKKEHQVNHALRAGVNHELQGLAADCLKEALIILNQRLSFYAKYAWLVGCFHDEVLVEVIAPNEKTKEHFYKLISKIVKDSLIEGFQKHLKQVRIEIGSDENNYEPLVISNWGEAK